MQGVPLVSSQTLPTYRTRLEEQKIFHTRMVYLCLTGQSRNTPYFSKKFIFHQRLLFQALTGVNCDDIVNLERFKLVGKSFLNFSVTFWLYKLYPNLNILQLRRLKQKILSNRNLYYCGAKLELGSYIKVCNFSISFRLSNLRRLPNH